MQYVVGDLEIDEDAFELRHEGSIVDVEPRVLEFVLYLIRNRVRLVTKDELLASLWQGGFVVESVVTRCASLARKALRDPSLIRTVYGRGYRWTAHNMSVRGADLPARAPD